MPVAVRGVTDYEVPVAVRRRALERRWTLILGLVFAAAVGVLLLTGRARLAQRLGLFWFIPAAIALVIARMVLARQDNAMVEHMRAEWQHRSRGNA